MATFNSNYKEMEDAEVWVQVVVEEHEDAEGTIHRKLMWQKLNKPLELGSVVNPKNQKVDGFKVERKQGIDIRGFMDGLFKR